MGCCTGFLGDRIRGGDFIGVTGVDLSCGGGGGDFGGGGGGDVGGGGGGGGLGSWGLLLVALVS